MENLKEKKIALFMNHFSSLKAWDDNGTFLKETKLYSRLADEFKAIYIFSYGDKRDLKYSALLKKNITIIPKPEWIPTICYEILIPFLHRKIIRQCAIFKTNQNSGALAPAIAKLIFRNKKFVVRSGYIGSEFARLSRLSFLAKAYFYIVEKTSYFLCDKAFIPQSDFDTLLKKYPFLKDKLVAMNNSIDTELFKKIETEKKYDLVYQARLDGVQKNHHGLMEAIEGLGLKLLLIGKGPEKENLLKESAKRKIAVTLLERVPNEELPLFYNSAKICAFPSFFEGNPKSLLECMSCEMPIVAFNVLGVSNLIKNERSGFLSKPDSQLMKNNILQLLKNSELKSQFGKNARQYIIENFSFDNLLQKEISVYKNLS
jgi:glycosyltransferase involved in cell wall biosynthesis